VFLGLAVPAAVLIRQGFVQLEVAEFRRQQLIAEDLVRSIDARLSAAIAVEDARPPTDFDYATPSVGAGNVVQLSPLSSLAATNAFPGTIGYFQVDAEGELSTPLLPQSRRDSVPEPERQAKSLVETELADVLEANRLLRARAAPATLVQARNEEAGLGATQAVASDSLAETNVSENVRGQAAFDELAVPAAREAEAPEKVADSDDAFALEAPESAAPPPVVRVSTFATELEPLRFSLLETGHLVLFRNAWRDGERFVQGMLIDRAAFIAEAVEPAFVNAGLAAGTRLAVAVSGTPIASFSIDGATASGSDSSRLYAARLSPPLAGIEVAFDSGTLERGPGFNVLAWTTIALVAVLVGGFLAMYRFGVKQIQLARQQQNFVSAVSHELKTPLTSIRMYGEMLKSGWADEEKKQVYYDYIYDEGERLSRLIDNVLQLARLNRTGPSMAMEPVTIKELFDILRSKLSSQAERAGFALEFTLESDAEDSVIAVDMDALTQVFINLVDNAVKFSGEADSHRITIGARAQGKDRIALTVRDYGPGIPAAEMKQLFELFYRPDNELTRSTAGTGIGLALVRQLVDAMSGRVDVRNRDPGAEFSITLPRRKRGQSPFREKGSDPS
jgi:signal transduction histidine kinase